MIITKKEINNGHTYGECFIDQRRKNVYVNIPKNASTWAKEYFEFGYNYLQFDNFNKNTGLKKLPKIVILRDPVSRWISGISEYLMRHPSVVDIDNNVLQLLINKMHFDPHTDCQVNFLHGLESNFCTFFYVDNKLQENLQDYMDQKHFEKGPNFFKVKDIKKNSMEENGNLRWKTQILDLMRLDDTIEKRIKEYYYDDYYLISKVNFYQKQIIR